MKKALIIAYNDLNNSGVPNVIYQSIKALHEEYSFDVLVFGDDEYYYQKLKSEGIDINLIKYIDEKPKGKFGRFLWWFHKRPHDHYVLMKKLLKENEYLVIHSFKEYYSWPFFKAAKEAGTQKRILHRNINPKKPRRLINRILEAKNRRLSIKYASTLIGVSEMCCKNAFRNRQYTILYNSYDEQKYNMNVKNMLSDDELVITQVASYNENKNQLFSLKVLKELKKLHANVRLNLVGATAIDSYFQSLINYAKTNDLENNVSFIERTDSVEKIYQKTTFAILSSFSEGLPITIIEAQACGINVFASMNVTNEVDAGGVEFIKLSNSSNYWAKEIFGKYLKYGNTRLLFKTDKFSFKKFQTSLESLYEK